MWLTGFDAPYLALGDDTLKAIACDLVETVQRNVTIDWTQKDSVKANLRGLVKCLLRKLSKGILFVKNAGHSSNTILFVSTG